MFEMKDISCIIAAIDRRRIVMPAVPENPPRPGYPASPCNNVCTLNDERLCIGCKRSLDEIVAWPTMTADEQWAVARSLSARRLR